MDLQHLVQMDRMEAKHSVGKVRTETGHVQYNYKNLSLFLFFFSD